MIALTLLVLAQTIPLPAQTALDAAAPKGARVEVRGWKPSSGKVCAANAAEVRSVVKSSGWIPVRLTGPGCEGWAFAQVALFVPALVVDVAVREGQRVTAVSQEREVISGRTFLDVLPDRAVATRTLPKGTVLEAQHVRGVGPAIGEEIVVVAGSGGLQIAQRGRVIGCPGGKACAQLPNGRRVEGTFNDGRLIVELQ